MVKDVTNVRRTPSGMLVLSSAPTVFGRGRSPDWSMGENPEGLFLVQVKPEVVTAVELRAEDLAQVRAFTLGTHTARTTEPAMGRIVEAAKTLGLL